MRHDLFVLLTLSAVSGGMLFLSSGTRYEKHLRYLSSLLLLIAMISPVGRLLFDSSDGIFALPEYRDPADLTLFSEKLARETEETLRENCQEKVRRETGLNNDDFSLSFTVTCEDRTFSVSEVTCTLHTLSAIARRESVGRALSDFSDVLIFREELHPNEAKKG